MNQDRVEPGHILASSEEALPGTGAFDDGEHVRATVFGDAQEDRAKYTATVRSATRTITTIEQGDIVVGEVTYLREDMASVKILEVRGKQGTLFQNVDATLRIRNVDNRFVESMEREFSVGDLIRAKVVGTRGGPQLATDKPDLGVIRGFTTRDPTLALVKKGDHLIDPETNRPERRKFATDYGSGTC